MAVALLIAWKTWGHWGDIQIDCGREMYVPVAILRGRLLYRDIMYQYGPLPPYLQALAFALFGINLNVLYLIGMMLVISAALLLFEIGREFHLVIPAAMTAPLFFLAESFRPSIFNFIFPYSYAASMAAVFGLACLYFSIKHALTGRLLWLGLAGFCTSLALLTKQEFGLACLGVLGFTALAPCLRRDSWRQVIEKGWICGVSLAPALLGYGLIVTKVSARTLFLDNWVMTPGTYTMRTIGHFKMASEGVRFGLREWSDAAFGAALSIVLWFAVAYANAFIIKRLGLRRIRYFLLLIVADLIATLLLINFVSPLWAGLPAFVGRMIFPEGIFLFGCGFLIVAIWKACQTRGEALHLAEAALGIYAVMAGIRVMMEMVPGHGYAPFFNGAVFVVFVIVVSRVISLASQSLDRQRRRRLIGCMMGAEAILLVIAFFPRHDLLTSRMQTDFGTIYTQPDRAVLFPQIVSFMKSHSRNGKDILVLPESPSLYFFSGLQSPSRWYEVQPGALDPKTELAFINDAESAQVQYVLLCNRHVDEFGIATFGIGYDRSVYKWLMANYTKVGQFGPRDDLLPPDSDAGFYQPYIMEVYEKKREGPKARSSG